VKKLYRLVQEIRADESSAFYTEERKESGDWLFVSNTFSHDIAIAERAYKRCLLGLDQRRIVLAEGESE